MLNSLKKYNFNRIWICDRCTDNTIDILKSYNEVYKETDKTLLGRRTSFARNLGLSLTNSNNDVLFLDGDRYIKDGDLSVLGKSKYDIELLLLENDSRINLDMNNYYGTLNNCFFSCGLFMKRQAINKAIKFQNGYLFDENIQRHWGIEDTYLGDICFHLNLSCVFNKDIKLNGSFDKRTIDNKILQKRIIRRKKLNVLW